MKLLIYRQSKGKSPYKTESEGRIDGPFDEGGSWAKITKVDEQGIMVDDIVITK